MTNKCVNSNSKEIIKGVVFSESCNIPQPENGKIICVNARSKAENAEALNGELRITVKTEFKAIILGESGYDYSISYAESVRSILSDGITGGTKAVINAVATDCEIVGNRATANVEISGWYLKENAITYLDSSMDDMLCRTEKIPVENILDLGFFKTELTNTDEARLPLKKILNISCSIHVNNAYPSSSSYQAEGELIYKITAVTDNDQFLNQVFSHPFGIDVAEEYCAADKILDVDPVVIRCEATLAEGGSGTLVTDTEILLRTTVSEKSEIEGVTDCYSLKKEITPVFSETKLKRCFCYRTMRDKITTIIKTEKLMNEIFCVISPYAEASAIQNEKGLAVEGLINCCVIFADENNEVKKMPLEIPFVTDIDRNYECETHLQPSVEVISVGARLRTGMEIEVSAEFSVTVRGTAENSASMVSDIEIGAEKEPDDFAISLYIVKPGETLWDVAKALNTDEETLLKLNDVKTPLTGGEKILIYKELTEAI